MSEGEIAIFLGGAISGLWAFTVWLFKTILASKDDDLKTLKKERDDCFAQKDALKDESKELLKSYQARDQADLDRFRNDRRKASP